MEVNINIRKISGALLLPVRESKASPARDKDLMNAIKNFASFMGLSYIPGRTIERLQNDREYRICFTPAAATGFFTTLYDEKFGKNARDRLLAILSDPAKVTDGDRCFGLGLYLNNFHGIMPGGYKREPLIFDPTIDHDLALLFSQVDAILMGKGLMDEAVKLGGKGLRECTSIPEKDKMKLKYYRLSLDIFDEMIKRHGYKPYDLIK
ncbi:MAG: hypothetical protein WC624_05170 [Candidatus Margulisiibacteriota bacterium]